MQLQQENIDSMKKVIELTNLALASLENLDEGLMCTSTLFSVNISSQLSDVVVITVLKSYFVRVKPSFNAFTVIFDNAVKLIKCQNIKTPAIMN